ncbi:MAG TPA: HAMP domain-containing sensor histidine kinase [Candidatus Polarisedimenticolia bacterium]|nr:HAMP domain-containing sensor histidine kinase [Candidatus Polarisedimenticolia bacterium]
MAILKRSPVWISVQAFVGLLLGASTAVAGALLLPTGSLRGVLAGLGVVVAGYSIGVLLAYKKRELSDIDYILRLREELRASQDHIMETATFESLGDYLEIAAHQMKDPLRGVVSAIQALAADPALPDEARRSVAALRAQWDSLFETLRHLSGFTLTKPARAPFSVNTLLRDSIRLCRHRAEEKKIVFDERYAVIPPVFGPADRTQKAILNVVVNAVEAMPFGGGTIVVETAHEAERVIVRVRDGGIGIKPEHLTRIFNPFFTTKPQKSGVGLGLWAARQTFDLIGADIRVSSVPLQGTEVTLSFPQAAPLRPGREGTTHPQELSRNTAEDGDRRIA